MHTFSDKIQARKSHVFMWHKCMSYNIRDILLVEIEKPPPERKHLEKPGQLILKAL